MTKKSIVSSSYIDKRAIHELLNKYLHPIENSDKYRYEDTWNDERIAKSVNPEFGAWHAQRVRTEVFGQLVARGVSINPGKRNTLLLRITTLENQVRRLITYCG